jgi:nicotinate-nucleotide pyrophosphorylase (carboxylating)
MSAAPTPPALRSWQTLVELALTEDIGPGDITSDLTISRETHGRARIEARQPLTACGLFVASEVFRRVDPDLHISAAYREGASAAAGDVLLRIEGSLHSVLVAERTALNFLGRLCGIATTTRAHVAAVSGTACQIVDTRKTLPGWRVLDKFAVAVGGGTNHRFGLYDGVLLKDNHIAAAGGLDAAVKAARSSAPAGLRVQVEVESAAQAEAACQAGADFLLLDNQAPEQVAEIVELIGDRALLEASGGIHLGNLRAYAETGVRRVSLGALTHSAPCCDVALEIDETFAPRAPG